MLAHMVDSAKGSSEGVAETDGRVDMAKADPGTPVELGTYESEEALKAQVKIVAECKSTDKAVHMLKDEKETFYLVAKGDDYIVAPGLHLGGVGGGHVIPRDADNKRCWPWSFPQGDKTLVQLASPTATEEEEAKDAKGTKFITGTLYAIARDLEAKSAVAPKLTSFGGLLPAGTAGRHQYVFECPEDDEKHEQLAFYPSPGSRPGGGAAQVHSAPVVTRLVGHVDCACPTRHALMHKMGPHCPQVLRIRRPRPRPTSS